MADDSKYPTRIAPYGLRMPPELKARVQRAADSAGRSLHAELLHALEEQYPPERLAIDDLIRLAAFLGDADERGLQEANKQLAIHDQRVELDRLDGEIVIKFRRRKPEEVEALRQAISRARRENQKD